MALITAAQARQHIPGITGTAEDALIEACIARAEEWAALWCGYTPTSAGATATMEDAARLVYLDGAIPDDPDTIRLPVWPVVSITSIYDSPGRGYSAAYLVDAADYEIEDAACGRVRLVFGAAHSWSTARRAIKVSYVAGYTAAPPALTLALCLLTRHVYDLRRRQGVTSTGGDASAPLTPETLPDVVQQALAPYRLPGVYL